MSGTLTRALTAIQALLVSGTNIKTVNSTTLLGSGDLPVQATLVSGTNIKTVNGGSLLGSGDLTISSGGLTLLGTLTTTSGTTQTLSGLTLTGYKFLLFDLNSVSGNTNGRSLLLGGIQVADDGGDRDTQWSGSILMSLITGVFTGQIIGGTTVAVGDTTYSTASTSITWSMSSGASFDNGSIKIYGLA